MLRALPTATAHHLHLKNFHNKYDAQYWSLCKNNFCNCKEEE